MAATSGTLALGRLASPEHPFTSATPAPVAFPGTSVLGHEVNVVVYDNVTATTGRTFPCRGAATEPEALTILAPFPVGLPTARIDGQDVIAHSSSGMSSTCRTFSLVCFAVPEQAITSIAPAPIIFTTECWWNFLCVTRIDKETVPGFT